MKSGIFPSLRVLRFSIDTVVFIVLGLVLYGILGRQKEDRDRVANSRVLQQWGIALNLYLIENDNQLPDVGKTPVTLDQTKAWFNVLPPYISEEPLAALPPGQRPRPGVPSLWIRPATKPVKIWDPEIFYFNYGMNKDLQPVEGTRSFRIYEISFPGSVIFLAPTDGYSPESGPDNIVFSSGQAPHILFCDGHVQPVPGATLLDPATLSAGSAERGVSWFRQ